MKIITSKVNGGQIVYMHNIETIPGVEDCESVLAQCTPAAIAAALKTLQKDLNVKDDSWNDAQIDVERVAGELVSQPDVVYGNYLLTLWFA